jgi:peptidoglycan/LPS O-acetylase OafA/YrhL
MQITEFRQCSSLSYISGLDGIRAIAVLAVILHHYSSPFTPVLVDRGGLWSIYSAIANLGWVGVDIFFVISGYLITKMLINKPIKSISDYKIFVTKRAWRLLPAYIFCLLVFTAAAVLFVPDSKVLNNSLHLWTMTSNIQSAFIHRTALMDAHFNFVHFWSLALEWHFYLLLPVLIYCLRSIRLIAILLIALAFYSRYLLQHFGASDNAIYAFTLCRFDALGVGCLLATATFLHRLKRQYRNIISITGLIVFSIVMLLITQSSIPYKKVPWVQLYGYSIIAISVGMILVAVITADKQTLLIRWLEKPLILNIGRASYSLYIWHLVFFPTIANIAVAKSSSPFYAFLAAFLVSSIVSAILTVISFKLIESKFYLANRQKTLPTVPQTL